MKQYLFLVLGFSALAVGGVGLLLPVLPTTPFVLCAAGCFGASSPKLRKTLEGSRFFGEYIQSYRRKSGIGKKTFVISLCFLWGMLALSAFFSRSLPLAVFLALVGTAVTIHLACLYGRRARVGTGQGKDLEGAALKHPPGGEGPLDPNC